MYNVLSTIHSLLRWVLLILLLACIIKSLLGWLSKRPFGTSDNKISLFLMISAHTQLLVAIWLYFVSPYVSFSAAAMQNAETRYFTMEHSMMMLVAIILITMGRVFSKKASTDIGKYRRLFWFNYIALLIIFMAIPWPGGHISRPWF